METNRRAYLREVWAVSKPYLWPSFPILGPLSIIAFAISGILGLIALASDSDDLTRAMYLVAGIFALAGVIGLAFYFFVSGPYQIWLRDAPLRVFRAEEKDALPTKFLWAGFRVRPITLTVAEHARVRIQPWVINTLTTEFKYAQVKATIVQGGDDKGEFVVTEEPNGIGPRHFLHWAEREVELTSPIEAGRLHEVQMHLAFYQADRILKIDSIPMGLPKNSN